MSSYLRHKYIHFRLGHIRVEKEVELRDIQGKGHENRFFANIPFPMI